MQNKQMDDNAKQLGPEWKPTEPLHSGKCYAAGRVQPAQPQTLTN